MPSKKQKLQPLDWTPEDWAAVQRVEALAAAAAAARAAPIPVAARAAAARAAVPAAPVNEDDPLNVVGYIGLGRRGRGKGDVMVASQQSPPPPPPPPPPPKRENHDDSRTFTQDQIRYGVRQTKEFIDYNLDDIYYQPMPFNSKESATKWFRTVINGESITEGDSEAVKDTFRVIINTYLPLPTFTNDYARNEQIATRWLERADHILYQAQNVVGSGMRRFHKPAYFT